MSKISPKHIIKKIIFIILSFIMSLLLFALGYCTVLQTTVLNQTFVTDNMVTSNYYTEMVDEITRRLTDLGNASGLDNTFFDGLVDELTIVNDTQNYIKSYYDGNGTKIDSTNFKQKFNERLDEYTKEKNTTVSSTEAREYLVNKATQIYTFSLELPLFSRLSAYILTAKTAMPFVIIGIVLLCIIIAVIIFVSNSWKHRVFRYYTSAFLGAFLSVGLIPAAGFLTGFISKINITSRALYQLIVQCANSMMTEALLISLIYLLLAVAMYFVYIKKRNNVK